MPASLRSNLLLSLAVLALGAAPAVAQNTAPPAAQPPVRATPDGFMVDFQDQDIRVVLSALAEAGGLNVTFSGLPNTRTTLRLNQPIPREQIIDVIRDIAQSNNLDVTEEGSLIRIERRTPLRGQLQIAASDMQLYTYRLKHASATEVAPVLMSLFSGIPIVRNAQANTPRSPAVFQLPPRVQQRGGQQEPPSRAVRATPRGAVILQPGGEPVMVGGGVDIPDDVPDEVRARMEQTLARMQQALGNAQQRQQPGNGLTLSNSAGEIRIVAEPSSNSLLVRATPQDWALVQQLVQTIDLRPLQVLIEVTIAEVRRTSELNVGVSGTATHTDRGDATPDVVAKLPSSASARDFVLALAGANGTIDFDVALNALASRGDLRVLSLPIIIAQNNKEAVLNVGSSRPFVQVSQSGVLDPTAVVQTIQYLDVGTVLTITPTINADGYVNLQVSQQANSATNEIQIDAPVLSKREATTQVFVRDGQTTVIGGLADNTRDHSRSGIPLLSRLPLIGGLFGNTSHNDVTSELFLFLTPHVISGDEDIDRLRDAVRDGSVLLKQVPTAPMIPPRPADTIPVPPPTAPPAARPDTSAGAPSAGRRPRVPAAPAPRVPPSPPPASPVTTPPPMPGEGA
ncbi:MAG TPA: secretin N-terminal domain-containing protein [Gemmatimonadaceae bacterium]|nr:secretin N-terminal domain-containing protein [Gemmatimonadaceae bacterium]